MGGGWGELISVLPLRSLRLGDFILINRSDAESAEVWKKGIFRPRPVLPLESYTNTEPKTKTRERIECSGKPLRCN